MKTKFSIPPYAITNRGLRGWTDSFPYTGPQLRTLKARKTRPRVWPYDPFPRLPRMHPVESNRLFSRWVWHNWKVTLTPNDRMLWENIAAAVTIKNYKGVSKILDGRHLYSYFEHAWKSYFYIAGNPLDVDDLTPDTTPFLPWTPPPAPTSIVVTNVTARGFQYTFTGITGYANRGPNMGTMIAQPATRQRWRFPHQIVDIYSSATQNSPWMGNYWGLADWTNVLPIPPKPGLYTARLRYLLPHDPWTPSDWTAFTVTVPVF